MNISQLLEALKNTEVSLTISEKLIAGVFVALLSMSVVFIVLVVIAGIISLLQREKKTDQTKDMGALVSVITASICVATGNSSNNIIVRKIERSNNTKSSWESMKKN